MKNKKMIVPFTLILIIVIGILTFRYKQVSNANRLDEIANEAMAKGDYEKAIEGYGNLYDKTGQSEYIDKKRKAVDLLVSKDNYQNGVNYLNKFDYINAAKSFLQVRESDNLYYKKAQEMLDKTTDEVLNRSDILVEDGGYDAALSLLDRYGKVVGENEKIQAKVSEIGSMKEDHQAVVTQEKEDMAMSDKEEEESREKAKQLAEEAKADAETKIKEEEEAAKEEEEEENQRLEELNQDEKLRNKAISLVGRNFLVTAQEANLYEDSDRISVITSIPQGSEVYVFEAVPKDSRVWCHVMVKSNETLNTYEGWIPSSYLEIVDE